MNTAREPEHPDQAPDGPAALIERSRDAQRRYDFTEMLRCAEQAQAASRTDPEGALRLAECRLFTGDTGGAIALLGQLESAAQNDAVLLQRVAERYTQCARHEDALRCLRRAAGLASDDARVLYNLAAACIANGAIEEAERNLTEVIRLNPSDYDAWYNRSTLRRQTPEANHVDQLRFVLNNLAAGDNPDRSGSGSGWIPVCFALAKELEDLGRYDESFSVLQNGAHARRSRLDYWVADDIATMDQIAATFGRDRMRAAPGLQEPGLPVFVLGLPRSGTTLVDRIISAHSRVASLGEINALAFAVMRLAGESGQRPGAQSKSELVAQSARIDSARLGERYRRALAGFGRSAERLIDKTPLNFLYIGLIRLALPDARIVHVRRNPMDSCYAMYKTLFRMGYPFTYSLQDTGRYTIAYRRLMAHWREVAGDLILDVDYEKLVQDPKTQTRRMLEFCGLPFEPACLSFHESDAPAATASAAQVREPIHTRSVGLWKHYAQHLGPLARKLEEHGIAIT